MPTYTYQCSSCGNAFEQFQKFSEDPLTKCPSCSGRVHRVMHAPGIVFKGSGWYVTDSRKSTSSTSASTSSSSSTTATASSSSSPTESAAPVAASAAE